MPSTGAYNYKLTKFLDNMSSPYVNFDHACAGTSTFVNEIQNSGINRDSFILSSDVESLFTNKPLQQTLEIAVDTILTNKVGLKISKDELLKLFTSERHFSFNDNFYEQVNGIGMRSLLSPTFANLFIGHHEGKWIEDYMGNKPSNYKRYVDDVIALFKDVNEGKTFLEYLNKKHVTIKFTIEIKKNKKLAFLDESLDHSEGVITRIYRTETFPRLMTNY